MSDLLVAALLYITFGWRVLPTHGVADGACTCGRDCGSPGKRPHVSAWQEAATTDEDQVRRWWGQWPQANVGIATGEATGLVVLDIDPPAGERTLSALVAENGKLPSTRTAVTGSGGRHLFFRHPGFPVPNSAGTLGSGIDVRGDGGFVVASPSRHISGAQYAWIDPEAPVVGLPDRWAELLRPTTRSSVGVATPPPAPPSEEETRRLGEHLAVAAERVRCAPAGARNDTLNRETFRMFRLVAAGVLDEDRVTEALRDAARAAGLGPGEVEPTLASAARAGKENPWSGQRRRLSDLGNAERLVDGHGADLRYSHPLRTWFAWDGTRWARDDSNEVVRRMKQTVRAIYAEAEDEPDEDERAKIAQWAIRSEDGRRIAEALKLARSEAPIVVAPNELDADPWVLNVMNGTIDLTTGELRGHRREDLITRRSPVAYDPKVRSQRWEDFLITATDGDEEMIDFLQRAVGYSLTGSTAEEVLFFLYGEGATGKSTLIDAVRGILGGAGDGYAKTADFDTFLRRTFAGGIRNDLARLAGARAVFSSEVDDGKELAEGVVKALTGGDTITARELYRPFVEFVPSFTLYLVANHRPSVSAEDDAMWRRIRVVPFRHIVPVADRDPDLKAALKDPKRDGPAVLAWAVEGCLAWQRDGLGIPPAVEDATLAYRGDMDLLRGFVGEVVEAAPGNWVTSEALRIAYESWARDRGVDALSQKKVATKLAELGATRVRRGGKHGWLGLRVVGDEAFGRTLTPVPEAPSG